VMDERHQMLAAWAAGPSEPTLHRPFSGSSPSHHRFSCLMGAPGRDRDTRAPSGSSLRENDSKNRARAVSDRTDSPGKVSVDGGGTAGRGPPLSLRLVARAIFES